MTNEEMAINIRAGHTEYCSELWGKVRWLMVKILNSKVKRYSLPNYLTSEDLQQELYFAFCKAVQAYDTTKPYKFNSYLDFHIRNLVNSLLKVEQIDGEPVKEFSYNQTVSDEDSTELIDLIPDTELEPLHSDIELIDLQKAVRQAISELPAEEQEALVLKFYRSYTYQQIAERQGTELYKAKKRTDKALLTLRRNKELKRIAEIYGWDLKDWHF